MRSRILGHRAAKGIGKSGTRLRERGCPHALHALQGRLVRIELPTLEARLIRRYKRFLADVELPDGSVVTAHCPNTGALLGCTPEGGRVVLRDSQDPGRKLRYTLQSVRVGRAWVNVDTSLPNALVAAAAEAGEIPELAGYASARREVRYGESSRIDLLLEAPRRKPCWVEVKSTTLAVGREARFPDAVTTRGLKHVRELERVVRSGGRAVAFFLGARSDVSRFAPAEDIDQDYARALVRARAAGVEVLAYASRVAPRRLEIGRPLELRLD